jgi:hypothetical protein
MSQENVKRRKSKKEKCDRKRKKMGTINARKDQN